MLRLAVARPASATHNSSTRHASTVTRVAWKSAKSGANASTSSAAVSNAAVSTSTPTKKEARTAAASIPPPVSSPLPAQASSSSTTTSSTNATFPLSYAESASSASSSPSASTSSLPAYSDTQQQQQQQPDVSASVFTGESDFNAQAASSAMQMTNGNANQQQQHQQHQQQSQQQGDWSTSFEGIGARPFSDRAIDILLAPVADQDIEVKPDGLIYLPEIKYRRVLNRAFGPGGWGMAPRGPHSVLGRTLTREYALIVHGRFVSQARGEQDFFAPEGLPTATEGCKSNALMRCCKDLGVASELWDPVFVRKWKEANAVEVWAQDVRSKAKKRLWKRKGEKLAYPFQEA